MRIDKMTATFGKLRQQTLAPEAGLNIIEAPNESGKSTWCAFLRVMLYGLATRERGALADKNRFSPWDGGTMQGTLELTQAGRRITISRDTARVNAPMGRFSAVYTGTAEAVPGLDGENCGEALLGVPREVFERSAFIRQTGLAVDQSPELERRVAALLSTGEEGASFTEVYNALKAQLNRRRHNRTGLLPALEGELAALEEQLRRADQLQDTLRTQRAESEELTRRREAVREMLRRHELADRAEQWENALRLKSAAEEAALRAETLSREIEGDGLPAEGSLRQLAAAAETLRQSADDEAQAQRRFSEAAEERRRTAEALGAHPMALQTPEEAAAKPLTLPPQPKLSPAAWALCILLNAVAGGVAAYTLKNVYLAVGGALLLAALGLLFMSRRISRRRTAWEAEVARLREERDRSLAVYTNLYREDTAARDRAAQALAARNAVAESRSRAMQGLLGAVALFAPGADTLDTAAEAVQCALSRRAAAENAKALAREAKLRYDILQQSLPAEAPAEAVTRPDGDPAALRAEDAALSQALDRLAREESRTEGELRAMGDHSALLGRREELTRRREALQREYDALNLAMETLSDANGELQSRFSPELGRQAGRIFSALTAGKYGGVLLDRSMNASAAATEEPIPRSAALLSQGGMDQLYLALRLAICRMVLPEENAVPLILDDALTSFDDRRLGYALELLLEESRSRQILLFTCQRREGAYLAGREGIALLRL